MTNNFWVGIAIAFPFILAWSAFLVFVDPLTIIADWWVDRRYKRTQRRWDESKHNNSRMKEITR